MDKPLNDVIRDEVWAKLGTEHDAFIAVDRAYIPVATGGYNATARDAARFGVMIRDKGVFRGERVLPASWLEHMVDVKDSDREAMARNPITRRLIGLPTKICGGFSMIRLRSFVRLVFMGR